MKKKALVLALIFSGALALQGQALADEYSNGVIQGDALSNVVNGVNQQANSSSSDAKLSNGSNPKAPWQDASLQKAAQATANHTAVSAGSGVSQSISGNAPLHAKWQYNSNLYGHKYRIRRCKYHYDKGRGKRTADFPCD